MSSFQHSNNVPFVDFYNTAIGLTGLIIACRLVSSCLVQLICCGDGLSVYL